MIHKGILRTVITIKSLVIFFKKVKSKIWLDLSLMGLVFGNEFGLVKARCVGFEI